LNTLDGWCALNSSAGGPLLALVTIGGVLAAGKSLISFPKRYEGGEVADRNRKNVFRNWVLGFGVATAILLFLDVVAYVYAYSQVRNVDKVCVEKLSDSGFQAIWLFFILVCITAVIGSIYAFMLARLKG
jgi:hypothetical protein